MVIMILPLQLVLLLLAVSSCHGYNVDLLSPLIVNSGLDTEQLKNYSFGFSLSHHIFSNGDKVLLAGAPGAEYEGLTEGGVYVCPLTHQGVCRRNTAFNYRNNSFMDFFGGDAIPQVERYFDDQMLGYKVTSKNGRVLACAPMYIGVRTGPDGLEYYQTTGRCIAMPRDFDDYSTPTQLFQSNFAAAGIDASLYRQSPSDDELYAIGSVRSGGSVPAQGAVYVLREMPDSVQQVSSSSFSIISNAQLQGYHVEQGHFLHNVTEDLLASGPKASRHRGQIIAYQRNGNDLDVVWTILGPASAIDGYFGYDFALLDLQTDGYDSLVVGCPLCDSDRGLVYVYIHTKDPANPINEDEVQVISLPGSQQQGQFGTAVENVGDIDQDGYEDVAISAPYEDSRGAVYLFRGGPNGLIVDDYQVISAPAGTVRFGLTVTAGIDVDDNMYPDFTVGDMANEAVYTFRSSPVIEVTITTKELNYTLDYTDRNCELEEIPSICFVITPCFNFSTMYGGVNEFAIQYTLIVDEIEQRVGLLDNILTNRVTNETVINSNEEKTCSTPHTFVLVPDFSKLDPIPMRITITNANDLLPLPSNNSAMHGGDLHPILSRASDGISLERQILPNYVQNCGDNDVCDPVFTIQVNPSIPTSNVVLWASAFTFSLRVRLQNTNEDSLAAVMVINIPEDIRLSNSESITAFAISSCESQSASVVQCSLKNPILVNEIVEFRVYFQPDVRDNIFEGQRLPFNFTVRDTATRGSAFVILAAQSEASYEVQGSFGVEEEQASRFLPSVNQSAITLSSQGPSVNYQVTVSHTGRDDEESPIPSLVINVIWPSVLTVEGGEKLPLLVPTGIVIIGSDSTTCREYRAIPNHLLSPNHQSPLVLSNFTADFEIEKCPNNVTCGVIQCEILNLPPQRSDISTATPPVQISIFSTLWSASVREPLNISVYANTESGTVYPMISESISDSLTTIKLQPAVTETQNDCFQLWIVIVSVLGGLVLGFFLVLVLGLCGCFGRGYYKKKQEEEQRRVLNNNRRNTDSSLGPRRIIPPPAGYTDSLTRSKAKEYEDELSGAGINGFSEPTMPGTFNSYPPPPPPAQNTNEEEITDEVVMKTFGANEMKILPAKEDNDMETEI